MLLKNEGTSPLLHEDYCLNVNDIKEIPDSIAQLWLCYRGVSAVEPSPQVIVEPIVQIEAKSSKTPKRKATRRRSTVKRAKK